MEQGKMHKKEKSPYLLMTYNMIPRNFVEKYGEGLPNTILLKPPNGDEWKLNLVKRDGKIWFDKGWKEFAEYHSLAYGHLLVFGYKGTSHFHVHIFDQSALEIKYPCKRVEANKTASNNGQGINKPPNDENPKDHRAGQKRKANSSFEFLHPCEMGSTRCFKVGNTFKLKKAALHNSDRKCKANSSLEFLQPCEKGSRCVEVGNTLKLQKVALHHTNRKCKGKQIITAKKVAALDRASSFKTCSPSFLVVMHRSYVVEARCMNLPHGFGKRHLDLGKKGGDIQLRVLNGEVWPARYCIWKDNTRTKFELSGGWKAFVKDNNLKVGDVCTFELIPGTKLTFQVHIFRETDNSTCLTSQDSIGGSTIKQKQPKVQDCEIGFRNAMLKLWLILFGPPWILFDIGMLRFLAGSFHVELEIGFKFLLEYIVACCGKKASSLPTKCLMEGYEEIFTKLTRCL